MTLTSRWNEPIPSCSLQKWIFDSSTGPLPNGDKRILIDADNPDTHFITKTQLRQFAKQIALGLVDAGFRPGDRALAFCPNSIYFPTVFLGILMSGGVFTGANPGFTSRELAYQLQNSGSSFLFVAPAQLEIAREAAKTAGLSPDKIYVLDPSVTPESLGKSTAQTNLPDGIHHWTELLKNKQSQAETWEWVEPADPSTTICCLNYSSGTTGVPKGVEITHSSYVANGVGVIALFDVDPDTVEFLKRSQALCFLPMYHAYAQTYFISIFPRMDLPSYVMAAFNFEKMLQHIEKFRITSLMCVPPILVALAKHPLSKKYDLSSVERVSSGAAPLGSEVAQEVESLWPDGRVTVRQGWGMTEVTCTCMNWDNRIKSNISAVGELAPNCSGKLMALDGKTAIEQANTRGELWVTGPTLMKGYWNNQKATDETIVVDTDGTRWLKTGDIAYVESYKPGGIFHIVDRIKELIKVKGNQVAPAELEDVLLEHKEIADVAVVGVPLDDDEVPRAYVVKAANSQLTGQQVVDWLEKRVVKHKRLKGGAVFVDLIPKNPSGKILRRALRDRAREEMKNGVASKL